MNLYKLTTLLPSSFTAAKKKALQEKLESILKISKGQIKKVEDWGEIELEYPIKKENSAVFLHFELELEADAAKKLGEKLRVEDGILRYLLVRNEK